MTTGQNNTFVGSTISSISSINNSTALGAFSGVAGFSNSTAIGGGTSSAIPGAVCSANNQIMLGRSTETVECPGTAASISLKAARNISVNGAVFGVGGASSNALFCGLTDGTGNGAGNTLYGSGSYANSSDGSSFRNTIIGSLTMTNTYSSYSDAVVVGNGCANTGTVANTANKITLLGATTSAANNESTAIGYGATATLANSIVLGRSTETVYCPGTNVSLYTTKNISVNGIGIGIGSEILGNANVYIGQGSASAGAGSNNTIVGRNSYTQALAYSGVYNTFLGAGSGGAVNTTLNYNTIIGGNSYPSVTNYDNASCLGYGCSIGGASSTAIGVNAATTVANQIMLGTTAEFVECSGTSTTNGCLKLNGGLKLQTAYGAVPSSTMLGYRISLSAIAITSFTSGVSQTIGSLALTVGVWSLNYTFELLADASVSTTQQAFFFSNQSGSAATYATRRDNTGTTRFHSAITYANTDRPAYSGGGTYYASSAITLYPAINITFSTGALTGTGYASATRIG